ncbi:MAG: hypothetical protein HYV27_17885 [Candidatus Hydrogenedentes bacterium]|nr:hypothetical protein [Candidatus Hydrogenedentota bacterium]
MFADVKRPTDASAHTSPFTQVGPTPAFARMSDGPFEYHAPWSNAITVDPDVFAKVGPTPSFLRETCMAG